jgi:hypothetical protein
MKAMAGPASTRRQKVNRQGEGEGEGEVACILGGFQRDLGERLYILVATI